MTSINNLVYRTLSSPMIISPDKKLMLASDPQSDFILTIDAASFSRKDMTYIEFKFSDKKINFIKKCHIEFWKRVQRAFIGDLNQ